MLDFPDAQIDFGVAALALTHDYQPAYDVGEGLRKLEEIAARVRGLLAQQPDGDEPEVRVAAINTVLYREYRFTYDLEDFPRQTPDKRLLGNVLTRGKGTCANLPDLYYAVAERLGFPIFMVEAPQHAFLRYVRPDGRHLNIEATASGGESADEDYVAEMEIPKAAIESGWMMRTLSRREALLLLVEEAAWQDERRGDFERVLQRWALLRRLRPNHGGTLWNSAVYSAVQGRALRELGRSDPEARRAATASFEQARAFALRASALGIVKPDNTGEYVRRQRAIRLARNGEAAQRPSPQVWDPLAALEDFIQKPQSAGAEHVVAYRRPAAFTEEPAGEEPAYRNPAAKARAGAHLDRVAAEGRDPKVQAALDLADEIDRVNRGGSAASQSLVHPGLSPTANKSMEVIDAVNDFNRPVATEQERLDALERLVRVTSSPPQSAARHFGGYQGGPR